MKFKNPLLVVGDIERSKQFYRDTLGLRVVQDFGANVTLSGGVCLQSESSWKGFTGVDSVAYGGTDAELYFEEDDFDAFAQKLESLCVNYLHPVKEHRWGQRAVRFFDPDGHIIEVGENMKAVCRRFLDSGMSEEQAAKRMDVPLKFVRACVRQTDR